MAELGRYLDPEASDQIRDKVYVDDGMAGGTPEDVKRMMGKKVGGQWTGTIPRILGLGGMHVKYMITSGTSDPEDLAALGGSALGVPYDVRLDVIPYKFRLEMPVKSETAAEGSPITEVRLKSLKEGRETLTQRNILSCIMGEYDPLGIISPALVRSKLMLRDLYGKEAKRGWDDALSREETQEWVERFSRQMVDGAAVFPRSVRPKEARGGPDLVGFADSSLQALCVAIYAVWDLQDESREARLLTAKCRVTPLHSTSFPRGELQAPHGYCWSPEAQS